MCWGSGSDTAGCLQGRYLLKGLLVSLRGTVQNLPGLGTDMGTGKAATLGNPSLAATSIGNSPGPSALSLPLAAHEEVATSL